MQTTLAIFSTFTLTLITTVMILYRIVTVTRQVNFPRRAQHTYRDIIDLIVQSSALYSVTLLIWAITWAIGPVITISSLPRQIPFAYMAKFIEEMSLLVGVRHTQLIL